MGALSKPGEPCKCFDSLLISQAPGPPFHSSWLATASTWTSFGSNPTWNRLGIAWITVLNEQPSIRSQEVQQTGSLRAMPQDILLANGTVGSCSIPFLPFNRLLHFKIPGIAMGRATFARFNFRSQRQEKGLGRYSSKLSTGMGQTCVPFMKKHGPFTGKLLTSFTGTDCPIMGHSHPAHTGSLHNFNHCIRKISADIPFQFISHFNKRCGICVDF